MFILTTNQLKSSSYKLHAVLKRRYMMIDKIENFFYAPVHRYFAVHTKAKAATVQAWLVPILQSKEPPQPFHTVALDAVWKLCFSPRPTTLMTSFLS